MGVIRKSVQVLQAVGVVGGALLIAYGWASTFHPLSGLIKDWRWGIGLGLVLFVFAASWILLDLHSRYVWWPRPYITFYPTNEECMGFFDKGEFYKVAQLEVFNHESIEITGCFATLISADDISFSPKEGTRKLQLIPFMDSDYKPDKLNWSETADVNDQHEITIPPQDARHIDVADTLKGFHYNLRKGEVKAGEIIPSRLHAFRIRIDGHVNGRAMKPCYFNGYIFSSLMINPKEAFIKNGRIKRKEEILRDQIEETKMIFRSGDWEKDRDIAGYLQMKAD